MTKNPSFNEFGFFKSIDKDGNEHKVKKTTVKPSTSGATKGALAGAAVAGVAGVAVAPLAIAGGVLGLIFGPED